MASTSSASNPTLDRLEDQIGWYDRRSGASQRWYKWLKVGSLVCAAVVPAVSFLPAGRGIAAGLGVAIVIIEGLQQLNQFQTNWIEFRSTGEALKHEKYLYLAEAGPYAGSDKPIALLAERIEAVVSQENLKWISVQEQQGSKRSAAKA